MLGTPTPRRVARYQNARGQVWDTLHHPDDAEEFRDSLNETWRRVALTSREYAHRDLAATELDALTAPPALM